MKQTFAITLKSREILMQYLDNYSLGQLNKIPDAFNNNLIWNIAHIVVVQQMLVYNLSGLPMAVSPEMVARYKRGTKPDGNASQDEVDQIRSLVLALASKTESDYENGIFIRYQPFTTMTGFEINSVEDAINFNNYHEGVHTGVMMAIRKFV